jgi:hypothetical protein
LSLPHPPGDFTSKSFALSVMLLPPGRPLLRISKHNSGEPYFGHSMSNRFDAPDGSFGTCYCGFTLACAFAETVLHDKAVKPGGGFDVPESLLRERWVVTLEHTGLSLASMHGADLLKVGADGRLSTEIPYDVPQLWSKALYDHPLYLDGFIYGSRRLNDEVAVVLFDRASTKLRPPVKYRNYLKHPGRWSVHEKLGVQVG